MMAKNLQLKKNCNKCEYKENECRLPKSGYYFGDEDDCENAIEELKKYYFALKLKGAEKEMEEKKEVEKPNQVIKQSKTRRITIIED